jgi:hypothetical protein
MVLLPAQGSTAGTTPVAALDGDWAEVDELPGLNHLFQTAATGGVREYGEIEETLAPSAMDLITGWILRRVAARAEPGA